MLTNTKERRAFARMVINAPVTVYQQQLVLEGICRDLSANGMGIAVSEHQLDINQPIRISLATNNNLLPPFEEESGLLLAVEFLPQG